MKLKQPILYSLLAFVIIIHSITVFAIDDITDFNTIFTDVSAKEWYAESVEYVYENKLMNGITPTTFEPETKITRGMIVTIIYRFEGSPGIHDTIKFLDVNKSYYYCTPIIWASENGIVNGVSKDTFAPDTEITREQFATILYRYAHYKGLDVSVDENKHMKKYSDKAMVSDYANEAMSWANYTKLITGVTTTTLVPQGLATRAQAATIFMRFDKLCNELMKQENESSSEPNIDEQDKQDSASDENNKTDNSTESGNNSQGKQELDSDNKSENENDAVYTKPTLIVGKASAKPGETVTLPITIKNNPGFAAMIMDLKYDEKVLTLQKVTFTPEYVEGGEDANISKNPVRIVWSSMENSIADLDLVLLEFKINSGTRLTETIIQLSYDNGNICDIDENDVHFDVVNGSINIEQEK